MTHKQWTDKALQLRERLKGLSRDERVELFKSLPENLRKKALSSAYILGRDKQVEALSSDADTILILCGRGWGKNWTGAHWLLDRVQRGHKATAAVAETAGDVRDDVVDPAEEDSGILDFARKQELKPKHKLSQSRVELKAPHGPARIQTYSGDSPDGIRGFSGSAMWIDELAKMRYQEKIMDDVGFTLREGGEDIGSSQLLITTTPRPTDTIIELVEDPDVHVIRGSSRENWSNLDDRFKKKVEKAEGTDLGKQEVKGLILKNAGDLWDHGDITAVEPHEVPELKRTVIGLDPSIKDEEGDEAGIIVVGLGTDDVAYVLADLSGQYTTREWGAVVVAAYLGDLSLINDYLDDTSNSDIQRALKHDLPQPADVIHAEQNQGGELVTQQLKTYSEYAAVTGTHTTQRKKVRAEPVHHLYQRREVKHVNRGSKSELEDQMATFLQGSDDDSPDRVDALVYAVNELKELSRTTDRTAEAFKTILSIN